MVGHQAIREDVYTLIIYLLGNKTKNIPKTVKQNNLEVQVPIITSRRSWARIGLPAQQLLHYIFVNKERRKLYILGYKLS